jgi:hypothetical protein
MRGVEGGLGARPSNPFVAAHGLGLPRGSCSITATKGEMTKATLVVVLLGIMLLAALAGPGVATANTAGNYAPCE